MGLPGRWLILPSGEEMHRPGAPTRLPWRRSPIWIRFAGLLFHWVSDGVYCVCDTVLHSRVGEFVLVYSDELCIFFLVFFFLG